MLPLMTNTGNFIIKGNRRVIIEKRIKIKIKQEDLNFTQFYLINDNKIITLNKIKRRFSILFKSNN